ncbi:unnamed protein product [Rotaria sp. Silwood1]|nr:unnamed protein product [Rotaria sp. Silwood1]CAF3458443.1 unnamed protein product [Rotaria sp. Silwood1]CAF3465812.1 unnamed protein product [Rotaria sp. Silwood1]CAF3486012.1 unnamed protein product [Rotaria sp. Silwood1]CAF4852815.1 unnamed protein product [Rotaria sp. Silwood1]
MERITNTLNSADSTPMISSTTPSDDENDADDHQQFPSSSSNLNIITTDNDVVTSHTIVNMNNNNNDCINIEDLSSFIQPSTSITTLDTSQFNSDLNLNTSNSELSFVQPLIEQHQTILPIYTSPINNDHERIISSSSSSTTSSSTSISSNSSIIPNCRSYMTLYFTDMFISAFIITPFVNIHWRGAWDLLDIHLLPDYPSRSALISMGIGYFMLYILYLTQSYLQKFYEKNRHNIMGLIMTRLYTLLLALAYINQWRGLWNLLDLTSNEWYHLLAETGISVTFLLLMKSVYNLNSAPFLIGIDTDSYFLLDSKYTVATNRFLQYNFDFFYYELVEAPLLTIAWRGLYNLSDKYICPDNRELSMIISFASGYLIFFLLALIQVPIVRCLLRQRHQYLYSFVSTLFHLIAFVSVVQIWRSLWIVCEQYLNIPEYHNTTLWLCYGASFVVLTCGLAACSLNGPGGSKDSYVDEGPILLFKFDYFSTLLKLQRTDENAPNQTASHSGVILWLIANVLRRQQQRRNSLLNQSRRSTMMSVDAPPSISENGRLNHSKVISGISLSPEVSSTDTIVIGKRFYGFKPP